jgi:tRNA(Ile)-lysidine synthase TilS/MesJ
MALAALCSQVQQIPYGNLRSLLLADYSQNPYGTPLSRNVKFQAFVVDHGVRDGSNLEAQDVLKVLKERNISTQVLKIDWAGCQRPGDLPNFESLARKRRFQALGKACRDQGINSLFLAHHEDDQVETLLMRLIAGHRMAGLRGIQPASEIPECYGLHGVHESGGIDDSAMNAQRVVPSTSALPASIEWKPRERPLEVEFGGVRIYRPLLSFSKERLIATCIEERMKWFEDHTNKDPSITVRNAIRHMYEHHALPTALSKPALLDLSKKFRAKREALLEFANSWLCKCEVKLETRSGILRVRFADLKSLNLQSLKIDGKYAAALLLSRISMLVTPQDRVNLSPLMGAVERVFPECFWTQPKPPPKTAFTVAGLQFNPLATRKAGESEGKHEWLIFRQPYMATTVPPRIDCPANLDASVEPPWSEWNLYDGRFWIRLRNLASTAMVIRPLRGYDLTVMEYSLLKPKKNMLRKLLWKLAPANVRWTLPAIAIRDLDGKEKVLALPTLDIGVPNVESMVKWEVRYKKIDLDGVTICNNREPQHEV